MAPPETACIAIAGPVIHNKVVMTNRNWSIDGNEVRSSRTTGVRLKASLDGEFHACDARMFIAPPAAFPVSSIGPTQLERRDKDRISTISCTELFCWTFL